MKSIAKSNLIINWIILVPSLIFRIIFSLRKRGTSVLFINTGKIGDLIVSSILLENDELLPFDRIILLIDSKSFDLFANYNGKIEIFPVNIAKLKSSPFYFLTVVKVLSNYRIGKCYNLTAARGILTEILSLISRAKLVYALSNDYNYIGLRLGKFLDRFVVNLLCTEFSNEYIKHKSLIQRFNLNMRENIIFYNNKTFDVKSNKSTELLSLRYLVIAPFTSERNRDWPKENFHRLIRVLSKKYFVVLVGSCEQSIDLYEISKDISNVLIIDGKLKLNELPHLISNAVLFIGHDSGLTHLAFRLNTKTIALIGGGMYDKFFPVPIIEIKNMIYLYHQMECFGCGWRCRFAKKDCIENISVETVLQSVEEMVV